MLTNAVAVYWLHDVDADRMGQLNLAYRELTLEFFVFAVVLTVILFLLTCVGTFALRLRDVPPSPTLAFVLGMAVPILQYPAEFAVRKLTAGNLTDAFLLAYLLLSPVACAAIILMNGHRRKRGKVTNPESLDHQPTF